MYRGFFRQFNEQTSNRTIADALEWIGWKEKVRNDSTIFVKPNFTWPKYRPGVVTSPRFLAQLLPILRERAKRVILGESDLPIFRASKAFAGLGIDRICKEAGVETVELSHVPRTNVKIKVERRDVRIILPKLLTDGSIDVVVNAPVPKCHVVTGMTGAMKNFYGLIPDAFRGNRYRHIINRAIVGVNKIVPSDLVVMDGAYSLAGRGPIMGKPILTNVVIAADNSLAADGIACRFFQMDPARIGHLRLGVKEGLGSFRDNEIKMEAPMHYSLRLRSRRSFMDYFAILTFKSRLVNRGIMNSPITPLLYKMLKPFRSAHEEAQYKQDIGDLPQSQYRAG